MSADAGLTRRQFRWLAVVVVLLALLLREQFIVFAVPSVPISGDIRQYVMYAYNLVHSGTFSTAPLGSVVAPDSFRGPGFPLFLALPMLLLPAGHEGAAYALALQLQALVGAATVLLCMCIGRRWLGRGWTLAAGLLVAVWPHHVAATGALLSEVVFGFSLVLGTWLTILARERHRLPLDFAAGLAFAYAYLVNPLALPLPWLLGLRSWTGRRRLALLLLLVPTLVAAGWGLRNQALPPPEGPGRAALNFVQGSWPLMHAAWVDRFEDPGAAAMLKEIDEEAMLLQRQPLAGAKTIAARLSQSPSGYARWYLIDKPYLLWDWDIRLGAGDIYFLDVERSPWETSPGLNALKRWLHLANPLIFLLSALAALVACWRFRAGEAGFALFAVACACVLVTAIHVVFQAEPRYAIAYRPLQMLMLVTALAWLADWLRARLRRAPRAGSG